MGGLIQPRSAKNLTDIRSALAKAHPKACHILTKVWEHQLDTDEWIFESQLFHQEDQGVADIATELCPSFLVKDGYPDRHRYHVTLLGALCADKGQADAELLTRCLQHMKERYAKGDLERPILNAELMENLSLDDTQAYRAARLIYTGGFCRVGYGGVSKNNGFALGLPPFMHDLQHELDLLWIVEATAMEFLKQQPEEIDEGALRTPALSHSQHAEVWDIPLANISKETSPLGRLWREYRKPDKTAALPLDKLTVLLRNYWSRRPDIKHEPITEDGVYDLYVKKGYAEERKNHSK